MIDHPHARLARRAWEAVARSDTETLAQVFREDLVWHAIGRGPRSGDYHGFQAVLDYLAELGEDAERFDSRFQDVLVGEQRAAVLFHLKGERRGRLLDTDYLLLFRIEEERIVEIWSIPSDQHAVAEFWS